MFNHWDIVSAKQGKDFEYFLSFDKPACKAKGLSRGTFQRYLDIYSYTERFGLPNGSGWANEDTFTLDLLRVIGSVVDDAKNWDFSKQRSI